MACCRFWESRKVKKTKFDLQIILDIPGTLINRSGKEIKVFRYTLTMLIY
jgi:hypothetical protein